MPGRYDRESRPTKEDYTGHVKDEATGLHYAGARYYSAAFGRWNAVDPLANYFPGHSPYNYVMNNPLVGVDPTGMAPCPYNEDKECGIIMDEVVVTAEDPNEGGYRPYRPNALVRFAIRNFGYEPYRHPAEGGPAVELRQAPKTQELWAFPSDSSRVGPSISGLDLMMLPGTVASGLRYSTKGLKAIFSRGGVRGKSIISIRKTLKKHGFKMTKARGKGYWFKNTAGEEVRIMRRRGGWRIRIENSHGNNLDEFGNVVSSMDEAHGIEVVSK